MFKLGFIVSGKGDNIVLKHFIKNSEALGILLHIYTYEGECTGISLAKEYNVAYTIIEAGINNIELSQNLSREVLKFKPDLIFLLFNRLLTDAFLNQNSCVVNIHPSILPAFPGFRAVDKAIEYGSRFTGVTAHLVDLSVDKGPVIIQSVIPISNQVNSYSDLKDILNYHYITIATQVLFWFKQNRLQIKDRKIEITDAKFELSHFYPNIENETLTICQNND